MKNISQIPALLLVLLYTTLPAQSETDRCEDCELMLEGMPSSIPWSTRISGNEDPGEPLVISGTIYKSDGKTPAPGVILYVYQTDQKGKYTSSKGQVSGRRHGHLRGWMKSDERGRYQFTTIRPGSYPNGNNPQHIHPIVKEPDLNYYWIDDFLFDDDPYLTEKEKTNHHQRAGSGILSLKKNDKGAWIGKRDIVLGKNIPGYRP